MTAIVTVNGAVSIETKRLRVLIVDDDEAVLESLGSALSQQDVEVLPVHDGQRALDLLRSIDEPPSLILLDLMMPIVDGWKVRDELLRDPELSRIPVVVITASDALKQGRVPDQVERVLEKPITFEQLRDLVRSHVPEWVTRTDT